MSESRTLIASVVYNAIAECPVPTSARSEEFLAESVIDALVGDPCIMIVSNCDSPSSYVELHNEHGHGPWWRDQALRIGQRVERWFGWL